MKILVTYDIETAFPEGQKRLRQVAKQCLNYGQRVQNSVFECSLTEVQFLSLKHAIKGIMDQEKDSVRFYHLPSGKKVSVECYGRDTSYNPEGILMV